MTLASDLNVVCRPQSARLHWPYPALLTDLPPEWLADWLVAHQYHDRGRVWDVGQTLWTLLDQHLAGCLGQRVAGQRTSYWSGVERSPVSGGLCKARARLPVGLAAAAAARVAQRAARWAADQDRPVYLLDGTWVALSDTAANQERWPQPSEQAAGLGQPVLHAVCLTRAATGCVTHCVLGTQTDHDARLGAGLWDQFVRGAVVVADQGFSSYGFLSGLARRGVQVVVRQHQRRKNSYPLPADLECDDHWETWRCPGTRGEFWDAVQPATLRVRVVRQRLAGGGVLVVNTLLSEAAADTAAVLALYAERWQVELRFRELKVDLGLALLTAGRPEVVEQAWGVGLLAHNLVCGLQSEAAARHCLPPHRLSYRLTLGALSASQLAREGSPEAVRKALCWEVAHFAQVPQRPGRSEPRALKRTPKRYPKLSQARQELRESRC
jgi:hypothetical protein